MFVAEKEQWHLSLSSQQSPAKRIGKSAHQIIISGSKECIEEVLMGKVPLRKLQKLQQLEIQGNFRQILLLEALLLLSREENVV